ncbi:MAG: methyltransferase domain-containing protein [Deltaproteobacteria bacterium]|nr:methyltransferase domain-containing protein [Deltaproteobacteria bacterium]
MAEQESFTPPTDPPPFVALFQMVTGYYISQAIYVAAKLGIADRLTNGPRSSDELAHTTGAHAPSLHRLLRLLVSAGVFAEQEDGRFALTPIGSYLQTETPGSLRAVALQFTGPLHQQAWSALLHSVQTGETAFDHLFGMELFPYLVQHPEEAAVFNAAMTAFSTQVATAVVTTYDFAPFGTIVDVGGGQGALLRAILHATPTARGVLFDLPQVVTGAKEPIEAASLTERCTIVGGDFFESVPSDGDAYLLSGVIHDWDDERSIAILHNCHRVMRPQGKLLLVEAVVPVRIDRSLPSQFSVRGDVNMLVHTGGRNRTEAEYRALFEAAQFTLTRIIPTQGAVKILEGMRRE